MCKVSSAPVIRSPHFEFRAAARAARRSAIWVLLILSTSIALMSAYAAENACSEVELQTSDHFEHLPAELCIPPGSGPFPAVVDLRPRICEGPVYSAFLGPVGAASLGLRGPRHQQLCDAWARTRRV